MKGVRRPNFERKEIAKMKKWKTGRKRSLLSIALFIALSVVASSRVTAQVECLGRCEAQFATCLINSNRVSLIQGTCLESYEACVDTCLGGSAAVLK
jgi:Asp/Glu/hydantoin racemase